MADTSLTITIRAVNEASSQIRSLISDMNRLGKAAGQSSKAGQKFRDSFSGNGRGFGSHNFSETAKANDRLNRGFDRTMGTMRDVGSTLTNNVSRPLIQLGSDILQVGGSFQKEMNQVKAFTDGVRFDDLRKQSKDLGKSTRFSATQAAQAQAQLASASLDSGEILGAMPAVLDLAAASNTGLARTAEISAGALSAFGLGADQMRGKANVLAKTFQRMNLGQDLSVFGTQFSKLAGSAKSAGIDFNQLVVALGAQGNEGMLKSGAANLGNVFKVLNDGGKRAKLAAKGINVLGENGTPDIIKLAEGLSDLRGEMSQVDFASFLQDTFGTQGGRGAAALVSQLDNMKAQLGEVNLSEAGAGEGDFLSGMVATQQKGLEGRVAEMQSALEGLKIELFDSGFGKAAEFGAVAIAKLASAFTTLINAVPGLGAFLGGIAAIAAVVGPLLLAVGFIGPALVQGFAIAAAAAGVIKGALVGVAAVAAGVTAPILAIVAAVAAVGLAIYKFWPAIQAYYTGIAQGFGSAMDSVGGLGNMFATAFAPLTEALAPAIEAVSSALGGLFKQSDAGVGTMFSLGQAVGVGLGTALQIVVTAIALVVKGFVMVGQAIGTAAGWVAMIGQQFMLFLTTIPSRLALLGAQIQAAFMSLGAAVMPAIQAIGMAFQGLVTTIITIATAIGSTLSAAFTSAIAVIQGAVASIGAAFGQLPGVISGVVSQAVGIIQGAAGMFQSAGAALMQALAAGIKGAIGAAVNAVSSAVGQIRGMLPFSPAKYGPLSDLDKTGPALLKTFAAGITDRPLVKALTPALGKAADLLRPQLSGGPLRAVVDYGAKLANPARSAVAAAPRVAPPPAARGPAQAAPAPSGGSAPVINLNFSPTINATDVSGVEQSLSDLEDRFRDMVQQAIAEGQRLAY